MIADRKAFIRANTRLKPVPHVPEISLYVADESVPIWQKTEEELDAMGLPPPYWAFAWAGGQALARYVLDHPRSGRRQARARSRGRLRPRRHRGREGRRRAGRSPLDIDAFTEAAVALNGEANGVYVE